MPFTADCNIFGAVHEDGINLVVRHLMRQRPSLFNYATEALAVDPRLLCRPIKAAPEVFASTDSLVEVVEPVPVVGASVPIGLNWCLQFQRIAIDFHPGNAIGLPPELGALAGQRFAIELQACAGLQCLGREMVAELLPEVEVAAVSRKERRPKDPLVPPLRGRDLRCFCLGVFAVGHFEWGTIGPTPTRWLKARLDGLEIVDIEPKGLEDTFECYISDVLQLGLLPRLSTPLERVVLDITKLLRGAGLAIGHQVSLVPSGASPSLVHNPAIEDDELKAFANVVVMPPL